VAGLALLASGCPDKPAPAAANGRAGLRVPLPEGWVAVPVGERLEAGPPGRPALVLETKDLPFPTADGLAALVQAERVKVSEKESTPTFVSVRYALGTDGGAATAGFLAAKQLGGKALFCSSAPGAKPDDVATALATCRDVTREGTK
jgi:hypothetical protein